MLGCQLLKCKIYVIICVLGWFLIYNLKSHSLTEFECNLTKIIESRALRWFLDSDKQNNLELFKNKLVKFLYSILSCLRVYWRKFLVETPHGHHKLLVDRLLSQGYKFTWLRNSKHFMGGIQIWLKSFRSHLETCWMLPSLFNTIELCCQGFSISWFWG